MIETEDSAPPAKRRTMRARVVALTLVATAAVAGLAACNTVTPPTSLTVEKSSVASSVRRIGYPTITSSQVRCWERQANTSAGPVTTRYSICEAGSEHGVTIAVDVAYQATSATAVTTMAEEVQVGSGWEQRQWRVSCSWTKANTAWTQTSCSSAVAL
jgi:hypothetical protein